MRSGPCPKAWTSHPVITHKFGIDQAAEAMRVSADPASGSSKVMLRLS